jgi:hypothetical protein
MLKVGCAYLMSGGVVKKADETYGQGVRVAVPCDARARPRARPRTSTNAPVWWSPPATSPPQRKFELAFDSKAIITLTDIFERLPPRLVLVQIHEIPSLLNNAFIDVIGSVRESLDIVQVTSKAGAMLNKRLLTIADESGYAINVTLWGDVRRRATRSPRRPTLTCARHSQFAKKDFFIGQVIAVSHVQISDYNSQRMVRPLRAPSSL